jgi:HlyD family secretion protein
MKRYKKWIVLAVALVVVAAGVVLYVRSRKPVPITYDTVKVERGRVVARITATGTLSALVTVLVGSQVSGRLQEIKVDFNSPVKKGDLLAKIDPELFRAAIEQARANAMAANGNLTKAQAQALDAQRQYERSKALFEKNLIAAADRDTAQSTAEAAAASVQAARGAVAQAAASLHQAQLNLSYCTILSPIDGVVISRSVDVGQTVAASLSAPTLFTIAEDLQKMQVDTNVAEADVGKLTPGMNASFKVDAYPNETFFGKVRQIRNAPQTVQNVVTYDAVIDVPNAGLKLKPGMTANVTFNYADRQDVLRVSNAALRFKPPADATASASASAAPAASGSAGAGPGGRGGGSRSGGERRDKDSDKRTVWLLSAAGPAPVILQPGVSDGSFTEVVSGDLKEGDSVITGVSSGDSGSKPASAAPAAGGPPGGMMRRMF